MRRRARRSDIQFFTCSACSQRSPSIDWLGDLTVAFDPDDMRRRRARNWAILVVLVVLCVLFYAITIVKMTKS